MAIIIAKIEETIIAYVIMLILGVHIILTTKKSRLQGKVLSYIGIVHLYYISYILTLLSFTVFKHNFKPYFYLSEILKFISIIGISIFTFTTIIYLLHSKIFDKRFVEYIAAMTLTISITLYVSTPFSGLIFKIDENMQYIRGPLYLFPYLISLVYYVFILMVIVNCIKTAYDKNEKKFAFMFIAFIMVPLVGQSVSIAVNVPILEISLAITFLIFYLDFSKRNVSTDSLTGLNNRRFLITDLYSLMKRKDRDKLVLLMIDANDFKKINDNFGHQEGDNSLIRIGQALEQCTYFLKHCTVARYGGDEFIIAFIERQNNDGRLIAYTITKTLEKINQEENAKSDVTISIGIENYKEEYLTPEEFIKAADDALYEIKKEKYTWKNFT